MKAADLPPGSCAPLFPDRCPTAPDSTARWSQMDCGGTWTESVSRNLRLLEAQKKSPTLLSLGNDIETCILSQVHVVE
jgi:hypothetical protein